MHSKDTQKPEAAEPGDGSHRGWKGERSCQKVDSNASHRENQGAGWGVLGQREDREGSYSPRSHCFSKLSGMSPLLSGP